MSSTANLELPSAAPIPQNAEAPASNISIAQQPWDAWFAWYPVKLYMTRRYCWLRTIYRRCVTKNGLESCEYTDQPEDYPGPPSSTPNPAAAEHKQ